jgi:hypothetical protein
MREPAASRDWLHVIQLPAYAPDLNPTEGVWSHVKRSVCNLAVTGVDHLAAVVKNRLKRIQYRPDLLTSFLAQTALTLDPQPRSPGAFNPASDRFNPLALGCGRCETLAAQAHAVQGPEDVGVHEGARHPFLV